jgi:FG-GAP-like repeat
VVVDDFNLDGIPDIAVAGRIGDSSLYYGNGNGTFKPAVRIHNSIGNFQDSGPSIAAGSFITGNKAPDLAIPIELDDKVATMLNTQ